MITAQFFASEKARLIARYIVTGVATYVLYFGLLLAVKVIPSTSVLFFLWPAIAFVIANIFNYVAHYFFTYKATTDHARTGAKFISVLALGAVGLGAMVYLLQGRVTVNQLIAAEMLYGMLWPLVSAVLLTIFVFKQHEK